MRRRIAAALSIVLGSSSGCGGAPPTLRDHVFYAHGTVPSRNEPSPVEVHIPALDRAATSPDGMSWFGVEVYGGGIRFARPADWTLRGGSPDPSARYLQYVSPRAALVAVYERDDAPHASWAEVQARYEAEVAAEHSVVVSAAVPVAAGNTQGRAYHVRHRVAASGAPFTNEAREILLRANGRIVLVQIVYEGELLPLSAELLPFLASFDLR